MPHANPFPIVLLLTPLLGAQETTLVGRVVDLRGEGVPLARVEVVDDPAHGPQLAAGTTDGEGWFRLPRAPWRDRCTVVASAAGHCRGATTLEYRQTSAIVTVHEATTVRGVVQDRDGAPVPGAIVRAMPEVEELAAADADTTTDANGRFEFAGVPFAPVRFVAVVPGQGLAQVVHRVGSGGAIVLTPSDDPTTDLHVAVHGLPPEVLAKVRFVGNQADGPRALPWPPPWDGLTMTPAGTGVLHDLPDVDHTVAPVVPGYRFAPKTGLAHRGQGPHRLEFVATADLDWELHCTVRLVDPAGQPAAGIVLHRLTNKSRIDAATTDSDGAAEFTLPAVGGRHIVLTARDDRWVVEAAVADGAGPPSRAQGPFSFEDGRPLALRLAPSCEVTGRLQRGDGRAAACVDLQLQVPTESDAGVLGGKALQWQARAHCRTDADGRFRFAGLFPLPDAARVEVRGADGKARSEPFHLETAGQQMVVPELTLSPMAAVAGVVHTADGRPAPGVCVQLSTRGQRHRTVTDGGGRYRFASIPDGEVSVLLPNPRRGAPPLVIETFAVVAGQTRTVDAVWGGD